MKHILLCHSGESETLAAIPALADRYGAGVVTVTVDVGQDGTSAGWRERALVAGAIRAHVLDARDEFARDYVLRALQACAVCEDAAAQGSALYRALLADKLADVAKMEGATIVAHGLEPQSDEALELERLVLDLRPDLVAVPARSLSPQNMGPGSSALAWAGHKAPPPHVTVGPGPSPPSLVSHISELRRGLAVALRAEADAPASGLLSVESTLWWRRAVLDLADPSLVPRRIPGVRQGLFTVTPVAWCPRGAASVEIAFKEGIPVSLNGIDMPLVELIEAIDTIAGDHGVGRRITGVDVSGIRRLAVVEAPAAGVLASAYVALAHAIESRPLWRLHRQLGKRYAELLHSGDWHSDTRRAIDAFAALTRERISGTVRLELRRGRCRVVRGSVRAENWPPVSVGPGPSAPACAGHRAPPPLLAHNNAPLPH